jgi:hypothetical protein
VVNVPMQIPLNTFYLLRILYVEAHDSKDNEIGSIGDFAFYALLSQATSKLDSLSMENREGVCNYRSVVMLAKILGPIHIVNRVFVLEEYLSLREINTPIPVETDLTDAKVLWEPAELATLHSNLDAVILPNFQLSDKRAREGVPADYFSESQESPRAS